MGLSDDLLRQDQRSFGGARTITKNQTTRSGRPKPTREQLQQWAGESKQYANQGGGGVGSFIKDYGRNASQLGGGLANIAGGAISAPFLLGADYAENTARSLLGATNPNPNKYRNESYNTVNGGVDKVSGVLDRTAGGARELLGWKEAKAVPVNQSPVNNTPADVVPMTPRQQASIEYNTTGSRPTSVPNIREVLNVGVPSFTNVKPSFDDNGNRAPDSSGMNIIPSLQSRNIKNDNSTLNPQIPVYNPGVQSTIMEDSTRGGYYQRKQADNKNKRTIEALNNKNKEAWGINRQIALDNSVLNNQSESRRLLSSQADSAQRNNELDRVISDVKASPEQRMAALQVKNLLGNGVQKQKNVVTKLSEEMPDGSKRERAVTIDPTTGDIVGGSSGQVSSSYITELAKKTGKSENDIRNELKAMGIDVT